MSKKGYDSVPVKQGEEIEAEVVDLAYGGEGVAKYNNFTIFIPFAIPGDKLTVVVDEVKKNYARASIKKVVNDSPLFTIPICGHFRKCGGCQWINMKYAGQLKYKMKILETTLKKTGGLEKVKIGKPVLHPEPFYYRERAQYKLAAGSEKISLGFYRAKSHEVIDVETCYIVKEKINEIIRHTREFLNSHKKEVTVYDERTGKGYIRHISVKVNSDNEALVTFVIAKNDVREYLRKYARFIRNKTEGIKGVTVNINTEKTNRVFSDKDTALEGSMHITERIGGINFRIGPATFFQVNSAMLKKMTEFTGKHIKSGEKVIDLYGGAGALSVPFYKKASEITVVDISRKSTEDLDEIIRENEIDNVIAVNESAEKAAGRLIQEKNPDTLVLDPPRKGVHPAIIREILKNKVRNIIYISCNPVTFARDIKELGGKYEIKEVVPVDLFPHTYHIEVMSHLRLK